MAGTTDNDSGGLLGSFYKRLEGYLDEFDKSKKGQVRETAVARPKGGEPQLFESLGTEELKELARRQHRVLEGLFSHPMDMGNVLAVYPSKDGKKGRVDVTHQGRVINVELPDGVSLAPGQPVRINHQTLQIVEVAPPVGVGVVAKVRTVLNKETSEVELNGSSRVVLNGLADPDKLHDGDRVVLDASNSIILLSLGAGDQNFKFGKKPKVTWDDIGGLEDAKRDLMEAVILPIIAADFFKHYHKKPMDGVLAYGPPGCGKTMLFEACASEIAKQHGQEAVEEGYILLRGPDILSEYVSIAERRLITAFEMGRAYKRKTGIRALLGIDECEALFKKRGTGISTDVTDSIVQTFLGQTNGLEEDNPFVILATNMPEVLDPAVVRPGRVDRRIKVSRPTRQAGIQIISRLMKPMPVTSPDTPDTLTDYTIEEFFSEKRGLCELKLKDGTMTTFGLPQLVSGAMLANVVDQATSVAIERDLKAKNKGGLTRQDILTAVERVFEQSKDLDNSGASRDYAQTLKSEVVDVKPLRQLVKP